MRKHPLFALALTLLGGMTAASGAGLYECPDAAGKLRYGEAPCTAAGGAQLAIDRARPAQPPALPVDGRSASLDRSPHRLTTAERQRILGLRRAESQMSSEGVVAAEIEIAAIREGADARLSVQDRDALDALRARLGAPERAAREDALQQFRAVYARYRGKARPRVQPAPGALGADDSVRPPTYREPPLGAPAPGTRGPLVATPPGPSGMPLPRTGPYADPNTGQVLMPSGDRLVDPLTGTIWMRSGRSYVDPATGRTVPAP